MIFGKSNEQQDAEHAIRVAQRLAQTKVHRHFAWWPVVLEDRGGRAWLQFVHRFHIRYRDGTYGRMRHYLSAEAAAKDCEFFCKLHP